MKKKTIEEYFWSTKDRTSVDTWEIGHTYEITVETYSDRFGYVAPKVVTDVKET